MSATLIDTNVLLDISTSDPDWSDWSISQLDQAALKGDLVINDIVYAEFSVGFTNIEALDIAIRRARVVLKPIPRAALFMAGKAYRRYRAAGGPRTAILPDFLIGAHAAVTGMSLLTRDKGRYGSYFPTVALVTP